MPVESSAGNYSWGVLAKIKDTGTESVESTVDSAQAPDPGEFGQEVTVEATIDAGPGGFWPESRPQARCPSSRVPVTSPGEFGQNQGYRHGVRRVNCGQCSGS